MKKFLSVVLVVTIYNYNAYAAIKPAVKSSSTSASSPVVMASTTTKYTVQLDPSVAKGSCTTQGTPCTAIYSTINDVFSVINNNTNDSKSIKKIEAITIPQFDFKLMTKFALGLNWKKATESQQSELIIQFRQLLIHTYATAVIKFPKSIVTITRAGNFDTNRAFVETSVEQPDGPKNQAVKVEYDLAKTGAGGSWKIYDVKIENASLVSTYRGQFNDIIQSSNGTAITTAGKNPNSATPQTATPQQSEQIEGLIEQLKVKNKTLATQGNS